VHWLLEELGVDYELVNFDFEKNEHKTPEYLALNPMGRVPTLVHGDIVVTEASAICVYLAEQFPEAGLHIEPNAPLRGSYLRWCFFAPVTAEPAIVGKAFGFSHPEYKPFAEIEEVADTLAEAVRDRTFVVGDTFSAADIAVGSVINWGFNALPVMPKRPELLAYWSRLEARPAWQRVAKSLA